MAQTGYFLQLTYKIGYGGIESFILVLPLKQAPRKNFPFGFTIWKNETLGWYSFA